ncbi:hypothetical protein DPMN_068844 [Dreissena polymorpha]|uniref:Uncharacterized protein n=1 Tax=Dreissena polymorpha TaxID=45954 RepID=A0A9D4BUJ9_DREPO|nr:hypothetical protein DPMN_068844 [Dreissena polymorpha]
MLIRVTMMKIVNDMMPYFERYNGEYVSFKTGSQNANLNCQSVQKRTKRTPYCSSGMYGQTERKTDTDRDRHKRFATCIHSSSSSIISNQTTSKTVPQTSRNIPDLERHSRNIPDDSHEGSRDNIKGRSGKISAEQVIEHATPELQVIEHATPELQVIEHATLELKVIEMRLLISVEQVIEHATLELMIDNATLSKLSVEQKVIEHATPE